MDAELRRLTRAARCGEVLALEELRVAVCRTGHQDSDALQVLLAPLGTRAWMVDVLKATGLQAAEETAIACGVRAVLKELGVTNGRVTVMRSTRSLRVCLRKCTTAEREAVAEALGVHPKEIHVLETRHREDRSDPQCDYYHPAGPELSMTWARTFVQAVATADRRSYASEPERRARLEARRKTRAQLHSDTVPDLDALRADLGRLAEGGKLTATALARVVSTTPATVRAWQAGTTLPSEVFQERLVRLREGLDRSEFLARDLFDARTDGWPNMVWWPDWAASWERAATEGLSQEQLWILDRAESQTPTGGYDPHGTDSREAWSDRRAFLAAVEELRWLCLVQRRKSRLVVTDQCRELRLRLDSHISLPYTS